MVREVLAFGDSLTWGVDPGTGRHPFADRWTSILESMDGDMRVIAEGLPGRTTCFDDHDGPANRNGARILPVLLASHSPLDTVIIMLGTNDLKPHLCGKAEGAAKGIERLVEIVVTFPYGHGRPPPNLLLVSPPHFRKPATPDGVLSGGRSIAESRKLAGLYAAIAARWGCGFFDAATVAEASLKDGIHLDAQNTRAVGAAISSLLGTH